MEVQKQSEIINSKEEFTPKRKKISNGDDDWKPLQRYKRESTEKKERAARREANLNEEAQTTDDQPIASPPQDILIDSVANSDESNEPDEDIDIVDESSVIVEEPLEELDIAQLTENLQVRRQVDAPSLLCFEEISMSADDEDLVLQEHDLRYLDEPPSDIEFFGGSNSSFDFDTFDASCSQLLYHH
eukprot:TRINITY_DN10434_c0_g1_i1.p1 TRINITY_DN10434_c0_g1~~TRINITY_DN10434_c0_g1_i1.p1  ORF type:complete len:212 (+),score=80.60 TRINITY_DN10434_c0_g1_i1:78-638(+)